MCVCVGEGFFVSNSIHSIQNVGRVITFDEWTTLHRLKTKMNRKIKTGQLNGRRNQIRNDDENMWNVFAHDTYNTVNRSMHHHRSRFYE